ncbi:MAG: GNAT family N-acetyltransferase [Candidatus Eisenbacteria bacterium]|uniref:GNAT family N-acetyltransferase n=1 Tax=Eiseniibacteriota bacterium TaxID=2212470 RepID=A0A956SDM3_UNCEI|nr:GNAT family N-acetyltransferase [Candidatus Eisenbacteria bacterium]MCB9466329.1 GNAT family N-acetyltransferase [Candidatus Eisenbacteria bacterium]
MGSERKSDWATPKPLPPGDRAATARVLDFLAAAQKDPARNVAYLGDDRDGIQSELEELVPSWEGTVRVCEDANGELRGVVLANWDTEIGLSWVYGPWTRPTDWDACASSLLDAALEQIPAGVTRYELSGACENAALAALAAERGAVSTDVNYALVLDGDALARISPSRAGEGFTIEEGGLVGRAPESLSAVDRDVLHELHEENFPTPYYSMDQLLAQHADGEAIVLVARMGGDVAGYAAGRVQPDGVGYVDFLAVAPAGRGHGVGRALMVELLARLRSRITRQEVCLTVRHSLGPARALYASLGFHVDASLVGYRVAL